MSEGVVYIATGDRYVEEAMESAKSLKKHNNLPATLYTDAESDLNVFDEVHRIGSATNDFGDSVLGPDMIPYEQNLFLDTDTRICSDISEIFDVLDQFEMVAAFDPTRTGQIDHNHTTNVPDCFPQYNTGVLGFTDTQNVRELFIEWKELYENMEGVKQKLNQPSFREALYESSIRFSTLPPEYNFRTPYVGFASGKVKIIHGRQPTDDLSVYENRINETDEMRVVTKESFPIEVRSNNDMSTVYELSWAVERVKQKVKREGISGLFREGVERLTHIP